MKPCDFPFGEEVTGRFRNTAGKARPEWLDRIVRVRAEDDGTTEFEFMDSGESLSANLIPDSLSARRAADIAGEAQVAVIVSITAIDCDAVDIHGRALPLPRHPIPIPSAIEIGDAFIDHVVRDRRALKVPADVLNWLREEFLIDECSSGVLWAGGGQRAHDAGFRLLGSCDVLDVGVGERGNLEARRVQERRNGSYGEGAFFLHEDSLQFVDRTLSSLSKGDLDGDSQPRYREAILDRLKAIALSGTWIEQWQKYNEEEASIAEESRSGLPVLEYTDCYAADDDVGSDEMVWVHNLDRGTVPLPWQRALDGNRVAVEFGPVDGESEKGYESEIGWLLKCETGVGRVRIAWPLGSPPPARGSIAASSRLEKSRIAKRDDALRKLKSMQVGNPRLKFFLDAEIHRLRVPQRRQKVSRDARLLFGKEGPNRQQQRALEVALATPDVALIQGPPGTGKTRVIQALVTNLNKGRPIDAARENVLVTSYQHEAVENAIEGLEFAGLPVDRRGGSGGEDSGMKLKRAWAKRIADRVDENAKRKEAPVAQTERRVQDLLDSWLRSGRTEDERQHFLKEVLDCARPFLSPGRIAEIQDALGTKTMAQGALTTVVDQDDRADIEIAIDAISEDEAGLQEHGTSGARRLKMRLGAYLDDLPAALCAPLNELLVSNDEVDFANLGARIPVWKTELKTALFEESPGLVEDRKNLSARVDDCFAGVLADLQEERSSGADAIVDILRDFANGLRLGTDETLREVIGRYSPVTATSCGQADSGRLGMRERSTFPVVVVDEAARANPLDLLIALVKGRRLVLVGDHKQLPQALEPEIERRLEEAGHEGLNEVYKKSLFEYLWGTLERQEEFDLIRRRVLLREQYRMHPVIGDFVSEQFYDGLLEHRVTPDDRPNRTGCYHDKPVAWIDVPREKGREERHGKSWKRKAEAFRVKRELERVLHKLASEETRQSEALVGVVTFYSAQAHLIQELIDDEHDGLPRSLRGRVRVGTVDAFQGREFEVVILSTVRSNDKKELRNRLGFTALPNRLCVAFSRARSVLVVVGDAQCVASQSDDGEPWSNTFAAFHELCQGEAGHAE